MTDDKVQQIIARRKAILRYMKKTDKFVSCAEIREKFFDNASGSYVYELIKKDLGSLMNRGFANKTGRGSTVRYRLTEKGMVGRYR